MKCLIDDVASKEPFISASSFIVELYISQQTQKAYTHLRLSSTKQHHIVDY